MGDRARLYRTASIFRGNEISTRRRRARIVFPLYYVKFDRRIQIFLMSANAFGYSEPFALGSKWNGGSS
jgi:hypothetical protein